MSDTRKPVTLHRLRAMHAAGEKIAMLTCYDASFARLLDAAGVDVLLVGDSLGMVLQGHASTLPVGLDEMAYHTQCVARGNGHAWIVADLPFGSYHAGIDQAMRSAASTLPPSAMKSRTKRGTGPCVIPSMSCSTSTWPLQRAPAPMPMTGIGNASVSSAPSALGTSSTTNIAAPASANSQPWRSKVCAACASRPCTR